MSTRFLSGLVLALFSVSCSDSSEPAATTNDAASESTPASASATSAGVELPGEAAHYAPCAACHLPTGLGVGGAFPPVKNRISAIASLDGGREYLLRVVNFGIAGSITVNGTTYVGVMPGHQNSMSHEAIAGALNFVAYQISDAMDPEFEPFTAAEAKAVQAAYGNSSMQDTHALREQLVEQHGDAWPN